MDKHYECITEDTESRVMMHHLSMKHNFTRTTMFYISAVNKEFDKEKKNYFLEYLRSIEHGYMLGTTFCWSGFNIRVSEDIKPSLRNRVMNKWFYLQGKISNRLYSDMVAANKGKNTLYYSILQSKFVPLVKLEFPDPIYDPDDECEIMYLIEYDLYDNLAYQIMSFIQYC
jgi:hypothetical protein